MLGLGKDFRLAARMLFKAPGFSIVATIALALGIGANTAIFSVVNAVLLRPLPFPKSEQLMTVWESNQRTGLNQGSVSYPNFFDWRSQNQVFAHLASSTQSDFMLTGRGDATRLRGIVASADLFRVLGVSPIIGRDFLPEEEQPGRRVAILSQKLFQERFNADASIVNQSITLNNNVYTVIGVMPSSFQYPVQNDPIDLWTTLSEDASGKEPITAQRGAHFLRVIGRLKDGVSKEQAQTEMNTIGARLAQQYPDQNAHKGVFVISALESLVGDIRPALLILLGAVALVLLIACANVANLLLARAVARQREIAIRSALGASRWRVVRQLLTESLLLSLTGGALGLVLAVWWSDVLVALDQANIPRSMQVGLDARVLLFTLAISLLTGIVFGVLPAFHSTRAELTEWLKEGRSSGEAARRNRLRNGLIVAELSVAIVLLIGAGLLIQSLWRLRHVDPGFNSENVLTFNVALPEVRYPSEKRAPFYSELISRIKALPGVQSASNTVPLPLSGDRFALSFEIDGRPVAKADQPSSEFAVIGNDYFRTMGIPLLKGRDFNEQDQHNSTPVIIVNQAFAQRFFPGEDAIGKHIKPGISTYDDEKAQMREIVGVVGNVKLKNLSDELRVAVYTPQTQIPFSEMTVVVRTTNDPHTIIGAVQNEARSIDRELPVFDIKTLKDYVNESVSTPRFNTTLLAVFASVALVLTIVGLYGVMSYSVAQRTGEIGIRMALGAQHFDVLKMIVGQGFKLVLIGLAIGLAGSLALTRIIRSLLFGVTTTDPITFAACGVLLTFIALLACYLPARRATKVDPLVALRYE